MNDLIVILILAVLLIGAISYIVKEKKKGVQCIGCSLAKTCSKNKNNSCNSHSDLLQDYKSGKL